MTFYIYDQNNSFGHFDVNRQVGHYVLIEAEDLKQADRVAQEKAAIYFDGIDKGIDCACCGDRWYPAAEWHAVPTEQEALDQCSIGEETVVHVYRANGEHAVVAHVSADDAQRLEILTDPSIIVIDARTYNG
jgi:hypothetical protein